MCDVGRSRSHCVVSTLQFGKWVSGAQRARQRRPRRPPDRLDARPPRRDKYTYSNKRHTFSHLLLVYHKTYLFCQVWMWSVLCIDAVSTRLPTITCSSLYSCLFSTVFFYMASYRVFKLIIRIVNEYFEHWYKVNLATQAKHRHYRNAIFEHHVSDWLNRLTVALAYLFRINFTQILFALCLVQSLVCKQHLEQSFGIVRCYHRFQTTGVPHKLRNNISDTALLSLSKQNKKNIAVFLNNL